MMNLKSVLKTQSIKFFLILSILFSGQVQSHENDPPIDLGLFEKKIYSQNGEDGVIEKIFSVIGTTNKFYVEFGVESGNECNTRYLRENYGWKGLMMDGFHQNESINLQREFITAENINKLFKKYKVPKEFDLLSIDIDYNDFYVWLSLKKYNPRVVVIEYNASHLPNEDKIVKYDVNGMWDGSNYFGASIYSLYKLGKLKGYTLVYADNMGVNLFFVRKDIAKDYHFIHSNNVSQIYKYPKYSDGPNGGHRKDEKNREFVKFKEAIKFKNTQSN